MSFATVREKYEARGAELKADRNSYEPAWRDISAQLVPDRTLWDPKNKNRGQIRNSLILNGKPVRANKALAAAMMSRITSPARRWAALTLADKDLAKYGKVREHLDICTQRILDALQVSGWYRALGNAAYLDLPSVATTAMFHEEGEGLTPMRFRPMPIGQYFLDIDHAGKVDTCFRDLGMTTRQLVGKFGLDRCSQGVRTAWDRANYNTLWSVWHAVFPNDDYQPGKMGPRGKRFKSCWWEPGNPEKDAFLRDGGYEEFPIHAPRWSALPEEVYGVGPGWDVRGDCKMLQSFEKARLEMFDKTVRPPLKVTGNIKRTSLLPADITRLPAGEQADVQPIITIVPGAMEEARISIRECEDRIAEALYGNLLLMFVNDDRAERPTATEVEAKRTESVLQFGPVLGNLDDELLEPAFERTYAILLRNNALPVPPPELQGQELKVEFISIMHEMQKATGLLSIRTFIQEAIGLANIHANVVDKIDADAILDDIAEVTGVNPNAILSDDKVRELRAVQAQQQIAQQRGQAMLAATQGVRNLSGADPQKLSDLAGALSPVAAAQGGALGPAAAA